MVDTPKGQKATRNNDADQTRGELDEPLLDDDEKDDLRESSPYREADHEDENDLFAELAIIEKEVLDPKENVESSIADNNAAQPQVIPRRSSRQSRPTDRLTVTRWKKKKDKTHINLNEEEAEPLPLIEVGIDQKEASYRPTEYVESSSTDDRNSGTENIEHCKWSGDELKRLHSAQIEINPTSTFDWQEVAARIETKTFYECQNKWQSMVDTPKGQKATRNNDADQTRGELDEPLLDDDEKDDLRESSPYREADHEDENDLFAELAIIEKEVLDPKENVESSIADNNAAQPQVIPRRSSRQSRPTDRLTVTRWKKKKDKTHVNLNEEEAEPLPLIEVGIDQEEASHRPTEYVESSSTDDRNSGTENIEHCNWSGDELKRLHSAQKEINPTSTFYWQEV